MDAYTRVFYHFGPVGSLQPRVRKYLEIENFMHNAAAIEYRTPWIMSDGNLSHINNAGEANMVDVSDKEVSARRAVATARLRMLPATLTAIEQDNLKKGEVLAVARIAGIQAAKRCADLIPLCHPLPLTKVTVDFEVTAEGELSIAAECRVSGRTGVEMEALTAASVAALTVYDMCKAIDKGMIIQDVCLLEKEGGKSGAWRREKDLQAGRE